LHNFAHRNASTSNLCLPVNPVAILKSQIAKQQSGRSTPTGLHSPKKLKLDSKRLLLPRLLQGTETYQSYASTSGRSSQNQDSKKIFIKSNAPTVLPMHHRSTRSSTTAAAIVASLAKQEAHYQLDEEDEDEDEVKFTSGGIQNVTQYDEMDEQEEDGYEGLDPDQMPDVEIQEEEDEDEDVMFVPNDEQINQHQGVQDEDEEEEYQDAYQDNGMFVGEGGEVLQHYEYDEGGTAEDINNNQSLMYEDVDDDEGGGNVAGSQEYEEALLMSD